MDTGINAPVAVSGVEACPVDSIGEECEVTSVVTDRRTPSAGGVVGEFTLDTASGPESPPAGADRVFADGAQSVYRFTNRGGDCPCARIPDHGFPVRWVRLSSRARTAPLPASASRIGCPPATAYTYTPFAYLRPLPPESMSLTEATDPETPTDDAPSRRSVAESRAYEFDESTPAFRVVVGADTRPTGFLIRASDENAARRQLMVAAIRLGFDRIGEDVRLEPVAADAAV